MVRRVVSLYPTVIQRARPAWGAIYHGSNTRPAFDAMRATLGSQVRRVLARRMLAMDPSLVISVHPLLNHITLAAMRAAKHRWPFATVVTDLTHLHRGWACAGSDLVVAPTEEARDALLRRGLDPYRVVVEGLPIDLSFRPPEEGERELVRRQLGLRTDVPTLLLTSGGEGSGDLLGQVRRLSWRPRPWQVIVVCGRNARLRKRLARLNFATPTLIMGFVDNMPELMRAADLVVGKAGPGAIGESLASGLPMIVTSYLPGQETPNVRFVEQAGVGVYAPHPDKLLETVWRLIQQRPDELRHMSEAARQMARPGASLRIARSCLDLCYSAASQVRR